ncbi:unnamed protein product, partial [Coregonus sp. 'balchen']
CNCSGRADTCVFDADQYRSTASGGRCLDCRDQTDGQHCERCRENHYRRSPQDPCSPCDCNTIGRVTVTVGAVWASALCWMVDVTAGLTWRDRRVTDTDGWSGQFSGVQEYPLLWKEGEVYLLPLSEDDLGFYRAPGWLLSAPRTKPSEAAANRERDRENQKQQKSH